jgi:hypothetical protein
MKLCLAACPVHAFDLVDYDSTFYLIDFDGQREWVWFALARQGTYYRQPAGSVIALIGQH